MATQNVVRRLSGSLAPDLRVKYLLRYLAPHVLSAVARRYRDFASSEDAVQEALIAAASQWPRSGVPNNLVGWLVGTGRAAADGGSGSERALTAES